MKRVAWVLPMLLLASSCGHEGAPAMAPRAQAGVPPLAPGMARVAFVRHASGCDSFDHARIVDEQGRFVGLLAPDTAFVTDVPPGRHAYFVWPGMDLRVERNPEFHPVGVVDLGLAPDTTRTVEVRVNTPAQGRGHCFQYSVFHFEKPSPEDASLANVRIVEADPARGRELLLERKEVTAAYFTMGQEILEQRRAKRAEEQRMLEKRRAAGFE